MLSDSAQRKTNPKSKRHCVFYRATHVHCIVSTVIEINVRHTGVPAQH